MYLQNAKSNSPFHSSRLAALIGGLLVLFASRLDLAAQQKTPNIGSGVSRAGVKQHDGQRLYFTDNVSFQFARLYQSSANEYDTLLLQTTQHNELNFEAEGARGSLEVHAWSMVGMVRGKPLWTFRSGGNEGLSLDDLGLYEATSWPCCSAMWVHVYYSLYNGQRLYTTNGSPSTQGVWSDPGLLPISGHAYKDERYVAFGASYEKGEQEPELQYGTERLRKQRFVLKGHEYGDNFDVPAMQLVDASGKQVQALAGALTFTIVLRFEEDQEPAAEVRVPVIDDVIRPELATLPKGYSLVLKAP